MISTTSRVATSTQRAFDRSLFGAKCSRSTKIDTVHSVANFIIGERKSSPRALIGEFGALRAKFVEVVRAELDPVGSRLQVFPADYSLEAN